MNPIPAETAHRRSSFTSRRKKNQSLVARVDELITSSINFHGFLYKFINFRFSNCIKRDDPEIAGVQLVKISSMPFALFLIFIET